MTKTCTADNGHITTYADVERDLRDALADMRRQRDEAIASRDSYLNHTQPAVLRRAEAAEDILERLAVTATLYNGRGKLSDLPERLADALANMRRQRDEALAEMESWKDDLTNVETDLETAEAAVERLTRERDEAQAQLERIGVHNRTVHEATETLIRKMTNELNEAQAEIERLEEALQSSWMED